jgi:tape measure domain-containing protein
MEGGDFSMSTVDERIVNMKIENRQLLSGVKSTQDALSSLNKTVDAAGKGQGMTGLGGAVDGVKSKFSALNVAAMTVVGTITNKLVNAGISLVKSITIDPIMAGFREYETNLNSVQTIMANTGKNVKTVNKYLNELNEYSDKTIYNFSEMARNIGTFTAAGVDLKTATASIKGIANLAALSGSNSQQAATAMYQLSQGIAAGRIGLQDWNSVVNAGMGGKVFQKALATTATVMGTLGENAVKTVGPMDKLTVAGASFRDSIMAKAGEKSWLSSEVLTTTLKTFTGDMTRAQLASEGFNKSQIKGILATAKRAQDAATKVKTFTQLVDVVRESVGSGFARIFQNLFGTFTEAKKLWTGVADVVTGKIGAFFDAIDKALFKWRELDGYKNLWAAIGNIFKALGNIIKPFTDALGMILPSTKNAGSGLAALTEGFLHFTEWLVKVTSGASALGPILEVIGMVFGAVLAVVVGVVKYFAELIPLVSGLTSGIASLVADAGALATRFLEWADIAGRMEKLFNTIIQGREAALKPILDTIGAIVAAFGLLFKGDISGFKLEFGEALTNLDPLIEKIQNFATTAQNFFKGMSIEAEGVLGKIAGYLSIAAEKVRAFSDSVRETFKSFTDAGASAAEGTSAKMASATEGASGALDTLKTVGGWIWIAIKGIGKGFAWLGEQIAEVFSEMDRYDFMTFFSFLTSGVIIYQIQKLIGQFAGFREIGTSIVGTFDQLTGTLKSMQNAVKAHMILNIAIAVGILAGSLWLLSKVPFPKLITGIGALWIMFKMLGQAMESLSEMAENESLKAGNIIAMAGAMVLMSMAMLNMSAAIAILGNMELETLAKGIGAITAVMAVFVLSSIALSKAEGPIVRAAIAFTILSVALNLMAGAIFLYSKISWDTLQSGLLKMGAALLVMAVGMNAFQGKKMISGAVALTIIAAAMNVLAIALKQFANIEDTSKALTTLGISLGILVVAINLMQGAVGGALALAVVASSIIVLANALKIMGSMDIPSLAKALGALAVALLIFLAAGAAASFVAVGLLALGAAILMIGAGLALAGVGLVMFAAGLATLAALGSAAFLVVQAAIQVFLSMLPLMAIQMAAAFVSFMRAMADAAPKIAKSFETIISEMIKTAERLLPKIDALITKWLDTSLKTIQRNAPKFGKTFRVLVDEGLKVLEFSIPRFARTGYRIILGLLDAMDKYVPKITRTAIDLIVSFINEISNGLTRITRAGTNLVIKFIEGIGKNAVRLADAAAGVLIDFLNGLADVIRRRSGQINDAGWNIASAIVDGMVSGLRGLGGRVWDAAMDLAQGLPKVVQKALGIDSPSKVFHQLGEFTGQGLANGITATQSLVMTAGGGLAYSTIDAAKKALDSHSPSLVFKQLGISVGTGFIAGIQSSLTMVAAAGATMAGYAIDTVSRTVSAMQFKAGALMAKARAYERAAAAASARARKKGASAAQKARDKAEAQRYKNAAKQARTLGVKTQRAADAENAAIDRAREFEAADAKGKAEMLTTEAEEAAKAAAVERENAIALAKEAQLIRAKDRKRAAALARAANIALANAERAAAKAQSKAAEAAQWSAEAVLASANEIASQIQAEKDEVALQARLGSMSAAEKVEFYKTESALAQAESDAKYAEAEALLAKAKAEAATNANQAQKDVDAAAAAVEAAKAAKAKAEGYLSSLESLTGSPAGGTASGGGSIDLSMFEMPDTTIASSLVYGAQNMFEAYSKALAATVDAASGDKAPTVQFIQNNTSPVALSQTEIYRQSKNLLSETERKLTGALT